MIEAIAVLAALFIVAGIVIAVRLKMPRKSRNQK